MLQATIDSLTAHIAVLSRAGEIVFVNKAWRIFAQKNGGRHDNVSVGTNYLDVCKEAFKIGCGQAGEFLNGLEKVLSGEKEFFSLEYPCHSENEERWFIGKVTAFTVKETKYAVISHETITERKKLESEINTINQRLEEKVKNRTVELEEMNVALNVLLKKNETDRLEVEDKIISNYESIVLPFIVRLKESLDDRQHKRLLDTITFNLKEVTSGFSKKINDPMRSLTPAEIQVAAMVKQGLTNKEISSTLNLAVRTVTSHRDAIRAKLGIRNKKLNLRSYLQSL